MGNTTSTSSRHHQKRSAAPRQVKTVKKSPFSFGSKKRAPPVATTSKPMTMRGIKAKMASTKSAPVAKKTGRNTKRTKVAKKNDGATMIKKYGPIAWTKAKASGVGPFKKQAPPPTKKAGLFSKLGSKNQRY
ncbi:hypothetical protein INT47_002247 [Mucor saturninus]|uniref:Uncharacterized protein n=1 Tax=Mucor saturninus TaxID=64648 RepID=A0A8H7R8F4_9FUNG|nr:hypothetical protein INT47_002247 [Mucor saturninus]